MECPYCHINYNNPIEKEYIEENGMCSNCDNGNFDEDYEEDY